MKEYDTRPSPLIAERLNQVFREKGLSNVKVAAKAGLDRKSVEAYRNCISKPNVNFIACLCKNYDVDANWLLGIK